VKQIVNLKVPDGFCPAIEVAACYCCFDGKFLFLQYGKHKEFAGTWAVPAGKFEPGENAVDCAKREMLEETGISLKESELKFFREFYVVYPKIDFTFHAFSVEFSNLPNIKINKIEHQNVQWFSPDQALKLNLVPGEKECLKFLLGAP
jgi:8-oxo-dGTP diphosphatase